MQIQTTYRKPCLTPKGLFRSTFSNMVPKVVNCNISQPPQVYFKWFLRTKVQLGKTLLAQFKIRTIKVYEIILCLKLEAIKFLRYTEVFKHFNI